MHNITLNSPWFEYVRDGQKIYEGRRRTTITDLLNIGDILIINHHTDPTNNNNFQVEITQFIHFKTFEDALNVLPLEQVLPSINSINDGIEVYKKYVSIPTQINDGITMIKIKNISIID